MLVIGSSALAVNKVYLGRAVSDLDIICTDQEFIAYIKAVASKHKYNIVKLDNKQDKRIAFLQHKKITFTIEANIVQETVDKPVIGSDWWLYYCLPEQYMSVHSGQYLYPDIDMYVVKPEVVLMMKLSHRYKKDSVHFHKTRNDILALREKGIVLDDFLVKILEYREKLTAPSGYKLNTTKKEFFTDNVSYQYDHDSLHRAVSYPMAPAYTRYMKDGAEVMCSKNKFFSLPEWVRMRGVFEEACVLALERAIIPYGTDPTKAFEIALEKVCTSITKGWFREYAWENYDMVRAMFNPDQLMGSFQDGLKRGIIKPYTA